MFGISICFCYRNFLKIADCGKLYVTKAGFSIKVGELDAAIKTLNNGIVKAFCRWKRRLSYHLLSWDVRTRGGMQAQPEALPLQQN